MNLKNYFQWILEKFSNLLDKTKSKNLQLKEPLSTIIRLSILYFNDESTKLLFTIILFYSQKPNLLFKEQVDF